VRGYITQERFILDKIRTRCRDLGLRPIDLTTGARVLAIARSLASRTSENKGYTIPGGKPWTGVGEYPQGSGAGQWFSFIYPRQAIEVVRSERYHGGRKNRNRRACGQRPALDRTLRSPAQSIGFRKVAERALLAEPRRTPDMCVGQRDSESQRGVEKRLATVPGSDLFLFVLAKADDPRFRSGAVFRPDNPARIASAAEARSRSVTF